MHFQQLIELTPTVDLISLYATSCRMEASPGIHRLVVVRRGHLLISTPGQEPAVCSQSFACHPEQGAYLIEVPKTKEVEYAVITYRMLPETSPWTLTGPLSTLSEIKIHYMIDELLRTTQEIHTHSIEEAAAQQFRKRMMLERILFIYLYESRIREDMKSTADSLEETLSYINEHYMLKLTLPMLARRAGVSEGHYTVLFKRHTGKTMTHYLHELRIEKAKQMFQQTNLLAKEIAQKVGYIDYFHFSKVFKKWTGCSPSTFQQALSVNNDQPTSKD
ncbi:helix-turn-helix transcriptional regulator [Paenibacillus agricola]|uniref:Helix-turn-helix transcriptional regulator n=1 Tax=Paenibacillus agricola TaxID=2716264 RepID=A0ABX0J7L4_9BACL|nr:AraC family transcriptional regulator [Paenibacillus agricola]NHN32132.1 helix-turn-helix transcriptional regulator [Paenibacillus agricola]